MSESVEETSGTLSINAKSKFPGSNDVKSISKHIKDEFTVDVIDLSKIKKILWTKETVSKYSYIYGFIIVLANNHKIVFSADKGYTDTEETIYSDDDESIFKPLFFKGRYTEDLSEDLKIRLSELFIYEIDHRRETKETASKVIGRAARNKLAIEKSLRPPGTLSDTDLGGEAYLLAKTKFEKRNRTVKKKAGGKTSRSKTYRSKK